MMIDNAPSGRVSISYKASRAAKASSSKRAHDFPSRKPPVIMKETSATTMKMTPLIDCSPLSMLADASARASH